MVTRASEESPIFTCLIKIVVYIYKDICLEKIRSLGVMYPVCLSIRKKTLVVQVQVPCMPIHGQGFGAEIGMH